MTREVIVMNYVDKINTGIDFLNTRDRRQKPAHIDYVYDNGYDAYQTLEYGRKYVKSNDFGFRANMLIKKAR